MGGSCLQRVGAATLCRELKLLILRKPLLAFPLFLLLTTEGSALKDGRRPVTAGRERRDWFGLAAGRGARQRSEKLLAETSAQL